MKPKRERKRKAKRKKKREREKVRAIGEDAGGFSEFRNNCLPVSRNQNRTMLCTAS